MCDPVTATVLGLASGVGMSYLQNKNNKKDKNRMNARISALEQEANKQVEANKIANQVQTTDELKPPTLADKLKEQKVPLNTSNTGATVGTPTSVGLNLGGY
jgi:hypothetical protein